jgi:hypothetical protein
MEYAFSRGIEHTALIRRKLRQFKKALQRMGIADNGRRTLKLKKSCSKRFMDGKE